MRSLCLSSLLLLHGACCCYIAPASRSECSNTASRRRCRPPLLWSGETSAELVIRAPPQLLFEVYADIERMPEWSPLLERVTLVDPAARRSEWALRVPRPLTRLVNAAGLQNLVQWEAMHELDPPRALRWRSLSGVQNSGEATFTPVAGQPRATTVRLRMSYTLPDLAGPLAETRLARPARHPAVRSHSQPPSRPWQAQSFVRRTMHGAMTRFRDAMEAQAAAAVAADDGGGGGAAVAEAAMEAAMKAAMEAPP